MQQITIELRIKGARGVSKNWQSVIAKSSHPCTGIHGVPEIEEAKKLYGAYYAEYHLVKEDKGFIFIEKFHKCGINGYHPSPKEAIANALSFSHISVFFDNLK